jgi:hypothetical protein
MKLAYPFEHQVKVSWIYAVQYENYEFFNKDSRENRFEQKHKYP